MNVATGPLVRLLRRRTLPQLPLGERASNQGRGEQRAAAPAEGRSNCGRAGYSGSAMIGAPTDSLILVSAKKQRDG